MLVKSQLYKNDIESFSLLYESQIELLASNMYVRNRHKSLSLMSVTFMFSS
jgi:cytochrome b involved in lipid metabolism